MQEASLHFRTCALIKKMSDAGQKSTVRVAFTTGSKYHIVNQDDVTGSKTVGQAVQQVVDTIENVKSEREGFYLFKKIDPSAAISSLIPEFNRGYSIFAPAKRGT